MFKATGIHVKKGYLVFLRRIANKLTDTQKQHVEVQNFLESIPEWAEYCSDNLQKHNYVETQPLAADPRKKSSVSNDDDFFVFNFMQKFKENCQVNKNNEEDEEEAVKVEETKED